MRTVLIVEDEKMIRQGLHVMIKRSGVPVETILECSNGLMALEILEKQQVDVMFTDIRMPKMDGIELVKKVSALPGKPLIVAISGYDDFSYAVEMLRSGVKEYMLKPVDREKMKEVLEKLEQELKKVQENEAYLQVTGCQQLKQVMYSSELTKAELLAMKEKLDGSLLPPYYYVCCLEKDKKPEKTHNCLVWAEENGTVLIVSQEEREAVWQTELRECYGGVSGLHQGIEELHGAWQEARRARKKAFCVCRRLAEWEKEADDSIKTGHFSMPAPGADGSIKTGHFSMPAPGTDDIHKMVQRIGTDRIGDSVREVETFLSRVKGGDFGAEELEAFLHQFTEEICSVYQNALQEQKDDLRQFSQPYRFACVDVLLTELTGWMFAFHEKIDTQYEDYRNRQKIEQAVSYIRENYGSDLNMAVVSNYVSMNYSLFSYEFKQYTGKNFVIFLKELRMEEAKRLLIETQLRVNEISQLVGYENEKHFMKTFKAECGVSATEYRKNMNLAH